MQEKRGLPPIRRKVEVIDGMQMELPTAPVNVLLFIFIYCKSVKVDICDGIDLDNLLEDRSRDINKLVIADIWDGIELVKLLTYRFRVCNPVNVDIWLGIDLDKLFAYRYRTCKPVKELREGDMVPTRAEELKSNRVTIPMLGETPPVQVIPVQATVVPAVAIAPLQSQPKK